MKTTLAQLFQESVIMQGAISLVVIGIWGYLLIAGLEVPSELSAVVTLVVGFFFGSKLSLTRANSKKVE